MACHIADGGDNLQIWMVAANILTKQSQTANKVWSSSQGIGQGANNSSQKNQPLAEYYTGSWN